CRSTGRDLHERLAPLPAPFCNADAGLLVSASRGLIGADLKAIVEDGKLQYAHDRVNGKPPRGVEEYFLEAIAAIRQNRQNYRKRRHDRVGDGVQFGFKG